MGLLNLLGLPGYSQTLKEPGLGSDRLPIKPAQTPIGPIVILCVPCWGIGEPTLSPLKPGLLWGIGILGPTWSDKEPRPPARGCREKLKQSSREILALA